VIAYAMPVLVIALAWIYALKPDVLSTIFKRSKNKERAA